MEALINWVKLYFALLMQVVLVGVLFLKAGGRFVQSELNVNLKRKKMLGLLVIVAVFMLVIPISGLVPAGYLRGIFGDLSITSLIFLLSRLAMILNGKELLSDLARRDVFVTAFFGGCFLYPMTLGLTIFDPYQLGYFANFNYQTICFMAILLVLTLWAWQRKSDAGWVLLGVILAYDLRLLESNNLWDYLIDPMLFFYVVVWLILDYRVLCTNRPKVR